MLRMRANTIGNRPKFLLDVVSWALLYKTEYSQQTDYAVIRLETDRFIQHTPVCFKVA